MFEGLEKILSDSRDYKEMNDMFSTCSCNGRPGKDNPYCERNPERKTASRSSYCLYFKGLNGTKHCDHKHPYKPKEEE